MRLGFAGTPEFAAIILERLLASSHEVRIVLTQPQKPSGRGSKPRPSAVQSLASQHGMAVEAPNRLRGNEHLIEGTDVLVVAAYGVILRPKALTTPRFGCVNVHASLLPRWRGAAPVERAIMAGDTMTGVSIMQMDAGLDTGPVHLQREIAIGAHTGASLTVALAELGGDALVEVLDRWDALPPPAPQSDDGVTYADKLTAKDALIDWRRPAAQLERQVRALAGRQAAYTTSADVRIRVLGATVDKAKLQPGTVDVVQGAIVVGCGEDALRLDTVQLNRGKGKPMSSAAARNGYPELFRPGAVFDAP